MERENAPRGFGRRARGQGRAGDGPDGAFDGELLVEALTGKLSRTSARAASTPPAPRRRAPRSARWHPEDRRPPSASRAACARRACRSRPCRRAGRLLSRRRRPPGPKGAGRRRAASTSFCSASVRNTVFRSTGGRRKSELQRLLLRQEHLRLGGRRRASRTIERERALSSQIASRTVAKADIPLVDARSRGVRSLLPVELDRDLIDRLHRRRRPSGPSRRLAAARIARGHLRLRVVALVTDERRQRGARAGVSDSTSKPPCRYQPHCRCRPISSPVKPVGLVDRGGIPDRRVDIESAQPEPAPPPVGVDVEECRPAGERAGRPASCGPGRSRPRRRTLRGRLR